MTPIMPAPRLRPATRDAIEDGPALRRAPAPREPSARGTPPGPSLTAGRLFIIFAPVLALIASAAVLAITAWTVGGYRSELLTAAELFAGAAGALATILLYRQIRQRQAANLALQSVTARVGDIVESAMDPIIATDESQRIVLFNAAAERALRLAARRSPGAADRQASPGTVSRKAPRPYRALWPDGDDGTTDGRPDRADRTSRQRRGISD